MLKTYQTIRFFIFFDTTVLEILVRSLKSLDNKKSQAKTLKYLGRPFLKPNILWILQFLDELKKV